MEECGIEPRITRHKQGWRYNAVPEEGLLETTGTRLFGGESVLINERVSPAGDKITWLRLKDGEGWLHDVDDQGHQVVILHSLRHRARNLNRSSRPSGPSLEKAYDAIITRLFHNDVAKGDSKASPRRNSGDDSSQPF